MDTVEAILHISVDVECPYCEAYFDLMDHRGLNDEGGIIEKACPNGSWHEEHKNFEIKTKCPECVKEIHIKGIGW